MLFPLPYLHTSAPPTHISSIVSIFYCWLQQPSHRHTDSSPHAHRHRQADTQILSVASGELKTGGYSKYLNLTMGALYFILYTLYFSDSIFFFLLGYPTIGISCLRHCLHLEMKSESHSYRRCRRVIKVLISTPALPWPSPSTQLCHCPCTYPLFWIAQPTDWNTYSYRYSTLFLVVFDEHLIEFSYNTALCLSPTPLTYLLSDI